MRNLIILLLLISSLYSDEEYQLGDGIKVDSLPLYLGGYFSIDYRNTDDENRYRIDDIALLAYGNYNNFSYMAEFEYKEFYVKTHSHGSVTSQRNSKLYTERLYLDYNLDENYMFRVGKFYSPIGFWNLLPINVLRETTSSPVSTNIIYPEFTSGLMASYSSYIDCEFKIDIMLQNNNDIDTEYNNYKTDKHYGIGITYAKNNYTLKLNSGYFHNNVFEDELYYFLLSAKYETDKYQILSEIGNQKSSAVRTTDYAAYVQGVYRFTQKHIAIARLEAYEDRLANFKDEIITLGYTYRPLYPIAFKSEYQLHKHSAQNQILLSFSVLF